VAREETLVGLPRLVQDCADRFNNRSSSAWAPPHNAGVLDKTDDGRIEFPYDAVRVDFLLEAPVGRLRLPQVGG
jgi:hypothetical protein